MEKFDVLVVGGGVAGLSTAYHLGKRHKKRVLVLEMENKLGGHSSGRNAGMIRQAIADPLLAKLACEGRKALADLDKSRWRGLNFRVNGSLLLSKGKSSELATTRKNLKSCGVNSFFISKKDAAKRVSILEDADFDEALFCPSDAFLDTQALLAAFAAHLKKISVPVLMGMPLRSLAKGPDGFTVHAGGRKFLCEKLVNASGAWAAHLAYAAGALKIPLTPYRRHLYWAHVFAKASKKWPFVWHVTSDFYFRPDKEGLMLSPCDKTGYNNNKIPASAEKSDPAKERVLKEKLSAFSPVFDQIRFYEAKAGLRTMSPDGKFVVGEDSKLKGFYWVAGLGGHGVTTSFSVGRLASDIISGKSADLKLQKALSPGRFHAA